MDMCCHGLDSSVYVCRKSSKVILYSIKREGCIHYQEAFQIEMLKEFLLSVLKIKIQNERKEKLSESRLLYDVRVGCAT